MFDAEALLRLRRFRRAEVLAAHRDAAERQAEEHVKETALDHARRALSGEACAAGARPADFVAWLPRGLAQRDRCVAERDRAAAAVATARAALVVARAAEEVTDLLLAECRVLRARKELRREQAWLDDLVAGRAAGGS